MDHGWIGNGSVNECTWIWMGGQVKYKLFKIIQTYLFYFNLILTEQFIRPGRPNQQMAFN